MDDYTDEEIREIATEVARELLEESGPMQQHMLWEIIEALEKGEDVDDNLVLTIFSRPMMDKLIDKLIEHDEE